MLFGHFFAFPPASDMSCETHPGCSQRHHPYQQPVVWAGLQPTLSIMVGLPKVKSTDKGNRKRITSRWRLKNRRAVTGGKGRRPFNKRSLSCRRDEPAPPRRRLDFLGWTFLSVWAVPRESYEQQAQAIASILYNTNIMLPMTIVWFGIQISPVKAWRSHGKHDSRLYTPSSRFMQKKRL